MRRSLMSMVLLALALSLVLVPCLYPQATKDPQSGLEKFDGRIMSINKDTSTITIQQTGKSATWQIVYTKDTTYTYRNQPGSINDVKEGLRIIVLGTFDKGSNKMTATRIDLREGK
jgi:hypothetical protein